MAREWTDEEIQRGIDADPDAREWTKEDFARARPASEFPALMKILRKTRGPQKAPTKKQVTLRLEPGIIEHFKAGGAGWQTRINDTLAKAVAAKAVAAKRK